MNLDLSQTLGKKATLNMFIKSFGFVVLFLSEGKKVGKSNILCLSQGATSCWVRELLGSVLCRAAEVQPIKTTDTNGAGGLPCPNPSFSSSCGEKELLSL